MPRLACDVGSADEGLEAAALAARIERTVGVDDHVPHLAAGSVRAPMKLAVDDQPATHAGRPGDVNHVSSASASSPVKLAEAGHVRVVRQLNLGAGCAREHGHQGHVLPRKVRRVDEDAVLEVDRAGRGDGDAAHLLATAVLVDLGRGPVDHRLRRSQRGRLGLDAGDQVSIRARKGDSDLSPAEIDAGQHG